MKKIILFLFFAPLLSLAQVTDDFSDGDFTQNPVWSGDVANFLINNFELQSNGPNVAGSKICLSTQNTMLAQTEWSFLIDLKFNPTSSTFVRVYLASNSSDLKGSLNGYFIQLGNTNDDFITFYKQSGTTVNQLFTGVTSLGTGNIKVRVKVTRDNTGNWLIYSDKTGGSNFTSEGTAVNDITYTSTSYFGVYCEYSTATRYNLYYFDDFSVGPIVVDNTPPQIASVNVVNPNRLEVMFNEAVDQPSVENIFHFSVDLGIGNPVSAQRDASDYRKVVLDFTSSFVMGLNYNLTVNNIKDITGNILASQSMGFIYQVPQLNDVVFNELMIDPSPPVGLPEYEYIELYNSTNAPINIQGWKLRYGTTEKILPLAIIPADSFVVLTSPSGYSLLSTYGNVVSVDGLSTTALTNTGTPLLLSDANDNIINALNYTDAWYQDNNKNDGGWSLEQIDAQNPCGGISNWRASKDISGGTPGRENSIQGNNIDNVKPDVLRVGIIDSVTIEIFFNESMLGSSLINSASYMIDNGIGVPVVVNPQSPLFFSVILKLGSQIQPFIKYKLTVDNQLTDCGGNSISERNFAYFGIAQKAIAHDIVINELLANPPTGGDDYVEIYNRSTKIIDLKDLRLTSKDTILNELTSVKVISDGSYLIFPSDYIVLTTSSTNVLKFYNTPNPQNFVNMASMPAFNITDGIVVIADNANAEIDLFVYKETMQYPLLTSSKGVSLERINYERPTDDPTNWHSAAEAVGFGTPAYKNSQFGNVEIGEDPVSLSPDIFSPDNDGHNDVLNISYKFSQPGYVANIKIFDANGRQARYLIKNELLGIEGTFSWDGITDDNLKATIGIYIVFFEVFDLNGKVKSYKKTTVLGGRLN